MIVWRRKRDLNPRTGYPTYSLSRGAPSPLGYFSMCELYKTYEIMECARWRRRRDSNSWSLAGSLVFKTSSLNHSDTPPTDIASQQGLCYHKKQHLSRDFEKIPPGGIGERRPLPWMTCEPGWKPWPTGRISNSTPNSAPA